MRREQESEEWLDKCMRCVHCYIAKNDADEVRCRCRNGCNFKEYKKREARSEMRTTYRIYGNVLNRWYNEDEKYGRYLTQVEVEYKEYDADTGELVSAGSEDFSTERYHSTIDERWLYTWDGNKRNKGGHRRFDDQGLVRYNKKDINLVKKHFAKLYNAELVSLRSAGRTNIIGRQPMKKKFYIIWDEKKNRDVYHYYTEVEVDDRKKAVDLYFDEQNYRRRNDLPHMFHVVIKGDANVDCKKWRELHVS